MKKYINWYFLWLKLYLSRLSFWIQLGGMLLLLFLLSAMELPAGDNLQIGLVKAGGEYGERIIQKLLEGESEFSFLLYDGEEELKRDILRGRTECGFVFSEKFEEKLQQGEIRNVIRSLTPPFSVKERVARETVYAAFFEVYSEEILKQKEMVLFEGEDSERTKRLVEGKRKYAKSDQVFWLEVVKLGSKEAAEPSDTADNIHPIRGMTGLLIFFLMLLSRGRKFTDEGKRINRALTSPDRFFFGALQILAAGTIPALAGWVALLILGESRGIFREGGMLLLLLLLGSIWIMLVGSLFRSETSFIAGTLAIIAASLLLCPIWINWDKIIPAMKSLSLVFPVGVYLLG